MNEKEFQRTCPQCNQIILYKTRSSYYMANKRNSNCESCRKNNLQKERNPFFGKSHSKESKDKIAYFNSEVRILSDEFLERAKSNLAKVTNKRSSYDIWLEKFGKEIADQKLQSFKNKQSKNQSGTNNPMYGKPAPQGSGNGWSGWYKGWYFRSLRELSFMINTIEKQSLQWRTPDKTFKISYKDYKGETRTYFPDFIIENTKVVEVKPERLHNTPKVLSKRLAAEEFCQKLSMTYEMIDPVLLSNEEIKDLYITGQIKFLDKYDEKFKKRFMKDA